MKFLLKISKKIPFFFILLLSSIILVPFMEKLKIGVVTILLFSIMPVTGVYSATKAKENRLIILAISIPFTITNLLPLIINKDCPIYDIAGYISIILGILTYGYTICTIMSSIIKPGKINQQTIYTAISGYLMIGFMWTILYILCVVHEIAGFTNYTPVINGEFNHNDLIYYSFTTLTTLGYGDMTPTDVITKSLSIFEAIIGQLYLTVLIALLIGKYLAQTIDTKKSSKNKEESP